MSRKHTSVCGVTSSSVAAADSPDLPGGENMHCSNIVQIERLFTITFICYYFAAVIKKSTERNLLLDNKLFLQQYI